MPISFCDWVRALLLCALALLPAASLFSQETPADDGAQPVSYSHIAPLATATTTDQPILVDGLLDEAIWSTSRPITGFTQIEPEEGAPVSERTEVRIAYDEEAIYIGAMFFDPEPITTRLIRRDTGQGDFDYLMVGLDSYHDHQTSYNFYINPSGSIRDAAMAGGNGGGDSSWDPVWSAGTRISDDGWSAELRIPFSQLRFSRSEAQVWGIQLERKIQRKQERAVFAFTPQLEQGGVPRYGHLEGIRGVEQSRRLELLPYVGARAEYRRIPLGAGVDFVNPYRTGSDYFGNAGLDIKYGVTSNITLDATVNPDFGQVEVDPAIINLTAFETQFDEKRPFFVEGAEIFRFGEGGPMGSTGRGPQLLYSRRIGRSPQGGIPAGAVYSNMPNTATILGAAKLTGKTANGWSLGVLEAVTNRESAPFINSSGVAGEALVEPMTNYVVARARREFNGNTTRLGAIGTAVNRDLAESDLDGRLLRSAYSGGIDFAHEWADRTWKISGTFTPSYVTGSAEAIERTQRSSVRYFHRPDVDYLEVDPTATSLAGYYAMVDLNKQAGAYTAKMTVAGASPGYEVNDLGFQTAADRIIFDTTFGYTQTVPGTLLRRWDIRGGPDAIWNYGGNRVFNEINAFGNFTLLNYWGGGWRLAFNPEVLNDRLTRGGPLSRDPRGYAGNVNVNSDNRKQFVGRSSYQWAFDEGDSWRHAVSLNLTYLPRDNWQISVGPELTRNRASAQYVTSVADPLAATYGRRYIFAPIEQTTLGLETRVNVTFTPTLSFEMYAQPFLSSGDYGTLKELREEGTFDFVEYGSDAGEVRETSDGFYDVDPDGSGDALEFRVPDLDFNYRSLLGNAVLRWEWRPGSTLFVVWQQSRDQRFTNRDRDLLTGPAGRFDFGDDVGELFGIRPANILLIKLNYWLNP
ncbi:MAG: DUF5916 domain-containing protein [Gemmatimonadota bacterium]